ncbi:hypothetical protein CMV_007262 [Castanea mollissima]|uniref:Uncharacterized protein n=1 Tax=Castanea mollissima TaxID=60419 RepID=A0A8J4RM57_9ROSI|nr:hypothetical protein CMV_007262 [Castanea mollissima]
MRNRFPWMEVFDPVKRKWKPLLNPGFSIRSDLVFTASLEDEDNQKILVATISPVGEIAQIYGYDVAACVWTKHLADCKMGFHCRVARPVRSIEMGYFDFGSFVTAGSTLYWASNRVEADYICRINAFDLVNQKSSEESLHTVLKVDKEEEEEEEEEYGDVYKHRLRVSILSVHKYSVDEWIPLLEILGQLAPDVSYRSLVMLGSASVEGLSVASFETDDVEHLLFFCTKQRKVIHPNNSVLAVSPSWLMPSPPSRKRSEPCQEIKPVTFSSLKRKNGDKRNGPADNFSKSTSLEKTWLWQISNSSMLGGGIFEGCNAVSDPPWTTRLIPQGGLAEFPDAILNAKRLDLFNLYREGVGNTLKRHYETYLLEYELAHDDVDGECCLLCHSSAAGHWVNCGICGEWAHFGCDRRQGLGAFKDYAKTDGLEYICPHCSITNFKKKSQKITNGY